MSKFYFEINGEHYIVEKGNYIYYLNKLHVTCTLRKLFQSHVGDDDDEYHYEYYYDSREIVIPHDASETEAEVKKHISVYYADISRTDFLAFQDIESCQCGSCQ